MEKDSKIYIAGHNGMVGSAILRRLTADGYTNAVVRTKAELDLRRQADVEAFFEKEKPDYVFLAAARVGGILANMKDKAYFLQENLQIQNNIIDCAYRTGVKKLLFLASSCIYPKAAPQPIPESALLTGALEPTNEGYALAKIAGLKLCEYYNSEHNANFISIMPCNLYGPNDNFDLNNSHFLPALIRRFHEAKTNKAPTVTVWGTGKVYRELMHVDDLANACVFVMNEYSGAEFLNVGYSEDYSIKDYANMVKSVTGYEGEIVFDTSKPDGMFRKLMDSSKIRGLGWKPEVELQSGIAQTYDWYLNSLK